MGGRIVVVHLHFILFYYCFTFEYPPTRQTYRRNCMSAKKDGSLMGGISGREDRVSNGGCERLPMEWNGEKCYRTARR